MFCRSIHDAGLKVFGVYEPYTVTRNAANGMVLNFEDDFIEMCDRYWSGEDIAMDKSQINFINGFYAYADTNSDTSIKVFEKFDTYLGGLV